jgi:RNA polymerase sigma-70 factor, ECF subfamily
MIGRYESEISQHTTDQQLVALCREGDPTAFGMIYERYERAVYRYAYHMLGNPDEADDIKQDAFVKAFRTIPGFRGDCSLLTWLLKVTGNLCRDRHKSQARRGETAIMPELEATLFDTSERGSDPAKQAERNYLRGAVHKVLSGLPEAQRELIILRDLEGLSYQQIADVLGCSVASVKLRLFRARRSFKDRMESLLKAK